MTSAAARLFLLLTFLLAALPVHALERFDFSAPLMFTTFRISVHAENRAQAEQAADAAFKRIAALNAVYSDYEPNSELILTCNAGPDKPVKISADLYDLVQRSLELAQITEGAFDITCGNLTHLWRRTKRTHKLPPAERLQQALAATDWHAVRLDEKAHTLTLLKPGMLLDVGGIAKGYAADAGLKVLREHGLKQALVMAGGDIAIGDPPPGEDAWEIKLRQFASEKQEEDLISVRLHNCGVSTSGDLYQFTEIEGKRYSHIVSPFTGMGLTQRVACSVIAPDCTTSDALATAMCVLGRERGEKAAAKVKGVTVKFAESNGDKK